MEGSAAVASELGETTDTTGGLPARGLSGRHKRGLVRLHEWQRTGSVGSAKRPPLDDEDEEEVVVLGTGGGLWGFAGVGAGTTPLLPPRFDSRSLEKRGDQTGQDGNLKTFKHEEQTDRNKHAKISRD